MWKWKKLVWNLYRRKLFNGLTNENKAAAQTLRRNEEMKMRRKYRRNRKPDECEANEANAAASENVHGENDNNEEAENYENILNEWKRAETLMSENTMAARKAVKYNV